MSDFSIWFPEEEQTHDMIRLEPTFNEGGTLADDLEAICEAEPTVYRVDDGKWVGEIIR
jgi:hypothetical protein